MIFCNVMWTGEASPLSTQWAHTKSERKENFGMCNIECQVESFVCEYIFFFAIKEKCFFLHSFIFRLLFTVIQKIEKNWDPKWWSAFKGNSTFIAVMNELKKKMWNCEFDICKNKESLERRGLNKKGKKILENIPNDGDKVVLFHYSYSYARGKKWNLKRSI